MSAVINPFESNDSARSRNAGKDASTSDPQVTAQLPATSTATATTTPSMDDPPSEQHQLADQTRATLRTLPTDQSQATLRTLPTDQAHATLTAPSADPAQAACEGPTGNIASGSSGAGNRSGSRRSRKNRRWTTQAVLTGALLLAAGVCLAAWTEQGSTIETLNDVLPEMQSTLGIPITSLAPADMPVLLLPGADRTLPSTWKIALVQSGLQFRPDGSKLVVDLGRVSTERETAFARRWDYTSISPPAGDAQAISSGRVAFYGDVVEGPYRVETDAEGVLLNGVRVVPAPGANTAPPEPTAEQEGLHTLYLTVAESMRAESSPPQSPDAREEVIAILMLSPFVDSATWDSEELVSIQLASGSEDYLDFSPQREPSPPTDDQLQDIFEIQANWLRSALRDDRFVLCGATYLCLVRGSNAPSFLGRLEEIRLSPESDALKLLRIQAHIHDRNAAADLLLAGR